VGKKSTPSPPPAPDPRATAQAQSAANRETAISQAQLNMIGQNTPWGSLSYSRTGEGSDGTPMYTATTTLSPQQQQLLDSQQGTELMMNQTGQELLANAGRELVKPISLSGLPGMPQLPQADESARTAALARILARANPELDRQRESIETRLANQGLMVGSEAYGRGVDEFNRARNDFTLGADIQAGDEMSRLFGLNLASYDRGVGARQQAITERLLPRQMTINELAALTGGSQVSMPQWSPTPQTGVAPTDTIGPQNMAYQGQLAGWNAQNQQRNATMGGLFGLGASAASTLPFFMMGSDRRIKDNIRKVGTLDNGLPVYAFRYKSGGPEQIGLMAQDVEKVNPAAVAEIDGVKHVNYGLAVL